MNAPLRESPSIAASGPRAASMADDPDSYAEAGAHQEPLRVAVVTPIPTPYRDPFWNEFARTPGIRLSVFYCSIGKADRPWTESWPREYESEVLPGRNLLRWRGSDASCFWNPAITRRLEEGGFDAIVVGGYNHPTMWAALWFAVRRKVPYFLMCESHQLSQRAGWRQWLKRPLLAWIVRRAAGLLPTGRLASEYLRHFGAGAEAMTMLPNVPDIDRLEAQVERLRSAGDFPGPAGFVGRPLVLFVGRLIPKKRAELVIGALHELRASNAVLAIVGDGPLLPELERQVDELGLRDRVHFAGFVQPNEVLRWYACARVFVLPSSETWGVVVIEALAAGLSVVVSDEVGCHPDVVTDPVLGAVVPARSRDALRDALERQLKPCETRDAFRAAWNEIGSGLRYDIVARNLARGLEAGVRRSANARD